MDPGIPIIILEVLPSNMGAFFFTRSTIMRHWLMFSILTKYKAIYSGHAMLNISCCASLFPSNSITLDRQMRVFQTCWQSCLAYNRSPVLTVCSDTPFLRSSSQCFRCHWPWLRYYGVISVYLSSFCCILFSCSRSRSIVDRAPTAYAYRFEM